MEKEYLKLLRERDELVKLADDESIKDGSFMIKLNELNIALWQLEERLDEAETES